MSSHLDPDQSRVLQALLAMQRHSWEQGVAGHAALDLGLDDLADSLAAYAVVRQAAWGGLGEMGDDGVMNGPANGEAVRRLAERGDPAAAPAFGRQLQWLLEDAPRAADGTLFHLAGSHQVWADTVYMVVPLLVLTGHADRAEAQLNGHRLRLYDVTSGLYAARWDDDDQRLVVPQHWGTGNGWVAAGIARSLHHGGLDEDWAQHARAILDACLPYRTGAGLFHDVVDDASTFEEGNLGQMLAYTAFVGVADGWLPREYLTVAEELLATSRTLLDDRGVLTPVCGAPHFDRPGVSPEAQAFFLLATAARGRVSAGL